MRQFFGPASFPRLLLLSSLLLGSQCKRLNQDAPPSSSSLSTAYSWSEDKVRQHLKFIAAEPHELGSPRQAELAAYLSREAKSYGLTVMEDRFVAKVPDPSLLRGQVSVMQTLTLDKTAQNIMARWEVPGSTCTILLGSHYDSKRLESQVSLGANDSGSSSAALLEIMRLLSEKKDYSRFRCHILAVWFDGEEAYLTNWRDGETRHPAAQIDNLYGSRYLASKLTPCSSGSSLCLPQELGGDKIEAMVLLDMIGSPDVQLTPDSNSDERLLGLARNLDQSLYGGQLFRSSLKPIEDDHMPFRERGIPVLNLINFEDLSTWHTSADTVESLSMKSIEKVGILTLQLLAKI